MELRTALLLCMTVTLTASCSKSGPEINDSCLYFNPIYVSHGDVLTDGTARQILTHDETWSVVCSPNMDRA